MANGLNRVYGLLLAVVIGCLPGVAEAQDWRDIRNGLEIPSLGYADQPFLVTLNDGSWLCVLTTGPGEEGATGQHVVSTRSSDRGATWSDLVAIEEPSSERGFESSWAVPLHVADQGSAEFGRVYAFYVFNGDPVLEVPNRGPDARLDTLGWLVYRFSDDGGATWSSRTRIDLPLTWVDRRSTFGGRAQMFWGTSEPEIVGERVLIAISKIRVHHVNETEGWVVACDNLLRESDPSKHEWTLMPNGNEGPVGEWRGLKSEELFGDVQSEHTPVAMATPGHVYMVNRTDRGLISYSISRDSGETWTEPAVVRYADGRPVRNPRANSKPWRIGPGRYVLWHHNHGGTGFADRNPAWLSGGIERDGTIVWGPPEIVLFDADPTTRMSYPDLIMEDGGYWIAETQKSIARVHPLDGSLIDGLWSSFDKPVRTDDAAVTSGEFDLGAGDGFSIEMSVLGSDLGTGDTLASSLDDQAQGWSVRSVQGDRRLVLSLNDGLTKLEWTTDPVPVHSTGEHAVLFVVDGSAGVMTVIADGVLQDGAGERQFGWGRIPSAMGVVRVSGIVREGVRLIMHGRALTTAEAVGNTRAGVP